MTPSPISIAVLGASGYTGAECIRLLLGHPHARIAALAGDSQAGKPLGAIYPHLAFAGLPDLVRAEHIDYRDIQAVFCCLPHGTTQEVVRALPAHVRIIDLSADFRLKDTALYETWYGHAHAAPELQQEAVYGLSEWARVELRTARLAACPGCYPTSAQLPLIPLLREKIIMPEAIIIDAKSGITGAGRGSKTANLFAEADGGISAYGIANHRHTPEIEQGLSGAAGRAVRVTFTPHLLPMARGILSTVYCRLQNGMDAADARASLERAYAQEPFVHIMPEGVSPSTHQVRGTNACRIGVFAGAEAGALILVSVIDNLVKGAAGQAVQNFNIMFGFDETTGLRQTALFP